MARDRQRAKQRRARRSQQPRQARPDPTPAAGEHLSGEVDEFEAAIAQGAAQAETGDRPAARRRPADDEPATEDRVGDEPVTEDRVVDEPDDVDHEAVEPDDDTDDLEPDDEDLAREAVGVAPAAARREVSDTPAGGTVTTRGPGRFFGFLRACWAELQRVQWPDRRQVGQATAVVIGFVVIAGAYLGVADRIAQELVNFVL